MHANDTMPLAPCSFLTMEVWNNDLDLIVDTTQQHAQHHWKLAPFILKIAHIKSSKLSGFELERVV